MGTPSLRRGFTNGMRQRPAISNLISNGERLRIDLAQSLELSWPDFATLLTFTVTLLVVLLHNGIAALQSEHMFLPQLSAGCNLNCSTRWRISDSTLEGYNLKWNQGLWVGT